MNNQPTTPPPHGLTGRLASLAVNARRFCAMIETWDFDKLPIHMYDVHCKEYHKVYDELCSEYREKYNNTLPYSAVKYINSAPFRNDQNEIIL